MPRFFIIVLDGVGAGGAPDAADYGDEGANTLGNLSRAVGGLHLPVMGSMGLGNIIPIEGVPGEPNPLASWGLMQERSKGKATITGHWELMGTITDVPVPAYPEGFPEEIKQAFEQTIGRRVLWNAARSGTDVMEEQGSEHMRTGSPIVYTSVDSVFQIAAHEDVIPIDELYSMCEAAREILTPPHNICRVIARPFIGSGEGGSPFERTPRRHDYAVMPPEGNVIDRLAAAGVPVVSVGKPSDMFAGRGFTETRKTESNADGMRKLDDLTGELPHGFVFSNLVDFDMIWGHRKDLEGFKRGLEDFDAWLEGFMKALKPGDLLAITADHGLDPTRPGTDHTREQVPILLYGPNPVELGVRDTFMDLGATVAAHFEIKGPHAGRSMTGTDL